MNRRQFLHGTLAAASVAAGTALVKLATPEEVSQLAVGRTTQLSQMPESRPASIESLRNAFFKGDPLYARSGDEFVPVGFVTRVDVKAELDAISSYEAEV